MKPATSAQDAAIAAALSQQWNAAVEINESIIKMDSNNIDALNRLGFAYAKLGKIKQAKAAYEKVLTLDRYNQIAEKNLAKIKNHTIQESSATMTSPLMFLEEPGKTKIVPLINVAPIKVLSNLVCGQEVHMKIKKHTIEIRDDQKQFIGALPDDVSFRLSRFIDGGNTYRIVIRSIGKNALSVFIRELARGSMYKDQPSFTPQSTYVVQGRTDDTQEKPDITPTGEEETSE